MDICQDGIQRSTQHTVQLGHNRGRVSCSWTMFSAFRKGEKYKDHFASGVYECAKCGYELFSRCEAVREL